MFQENKMNTKMRAFGGWRSRSAAVLAVLAVAGMEGRVKGQDGDPKSSLQQKLSSRYVLAQVAKDRTSVLTAGTLLTLQKDNFLMYVGSCAMSPANTYKGGKLTQSFGQNLGRGMLSGMKSGGATTTDCPPRKFPRGAYLFVTKIDIQKDGIVFQLFATPDNEAPYYADLKFPFERGSVPASAQALSMIGEVLQIQPDAPASTASATAQQTLAAATPAPAAVPAEARLAPIAPPPPPAADPAPAAPLAAIPPPPPPAADPVTVEIGQTVQHVESALGKPDTILKMGAGTIRYVYSGQSIKVTFKNGKVSDIQ
jgi:hypothetical protein